MSALTQQCHDGFTALLTARLSQAHAKALPTLAIAGLERLVAAGRAGRAKVTLRAEKLLADALQLRVDLLQTCVNL